MGSKQEYSKTYINDFSSTKGKRNFFILMDGTWNDESGKDGDGLVTNVVNLHRCLAGDSKQQITRYFRGVGNDEENSFFGIIRGGAFGANEKRIRNNAYSTLVKEYRNGDRIFILGFSRGAATARMLASQIKKEGIREKITITTKPVSNKFTKNIEHKFIRYELDGERKDVDVVFLGVWDTVYAFGIPISIGPFQFNKWDLFRDKNVSSNVKNAVHLIAIDETRDPFTPTLMNYDADRVDEVWFSGVHSDVGGSFKEDELARITLNYMVNRMKEVVKENNYTAIKFKNDILSSKTDVTTSKRSLHFYGLGFKKSIRKIHVLENDEQSGLPPLIHKSVFEHQDSSDIVSVVEKKSFFSRKKTVREIPIIYNPPNLRPLGDNFTVNSKD